MLICTWQEADGSCLPKVSMQSVTSSPPKTRERTTQRSAMFPRLHKASESHMARCLLCSGGGGGGEWQRHKAEPVHPTHPATEPVHGNVLPRVFGKPVQNVQRGTRARFGLLHLHKPVGTFNDKGRVHVVRCAYSCPVLFAPERYTHDRLF